MAMRVATFATSERMLQASMATQARMAEMQMQQASGQVSTDYGGLGSDSLSLINLELALSRSETYSASATVAAGRVEVMYSTMDTINDLLASFRTSLTAINSTDSNEETNAALSTTAQTYMEELETLLNTQYEGRYLFSGSATMTAPVDLTDYDASSEETTSYYQGNDNLASVQVSSEQTVSYGVTADNEAFEAAFQALGIIAAADGEFDQALIEEALNLVVAAIDGAAGVQGGLSVNAATLERAQAREETYRSTLSESISAVRDVDVTELAVKLAAYEVQLEGAYSTMATILSLNLSEYLR